MAGKKGMKWGGRSPAAADALRARIDAAKIVKYLTDHISGASEMTASQVTAGLGLLRKVIPDISAVEHSGEVEQKHYVMQVPVPAIEPSEWEREVQSRAAIPYQ